MMFDSSQLSLAVSLVSLAVGILVFWAQPSRFTNQIFLLWALLVAAVTGCLYGAEIANNLRIIDSVGPKNWLRTMNALGVLSPWVLWLLKEAILADDGHPRRIVRPTIPLLALSLIFAGLCYTDWFYLPGQPYGEFKGGIAFATAALFFLTSHLALAVRAAQQWRAVSGIRRVEMQFFVVSMSVSLLVCGLLALATTLTGITEFRRQIKIVILLAFALTAWGIAVYRVFNVRQVILTLCPYAAVTLCLGLAIVGLRQLFSGIVPMPMDLWLSVTLVVPFVPWLDRKMQAWFQVSEENITAEWRAAVIALARIEASPEKLASSFEKLLCERCGAKSAALLFRCENGHASSSLALTSDRPGHGELVRVGWATLESIRRRRSSIPLLDLGQFLTSHALGVVVAVPQSSLSPALLVAVGAKANEWPFTFPEVQRLIRVAELMDNILSHARLAADAALKARTEHLALLSRGLAHDLKNLITPISSFIVHAEGKLAPGSPEAEVHGAAKRAVRRMNDYVGESLFFSSRLSPRFERTDIPSLLESVREFSSERALARGIRLSVASDGPASLTADRVLLQRMLGNLVDNAIDASRTGQTVRLRWLTPKPSHVHFEIADEGRGIPAENLARVFEPYFTTKHFGDEVRGFGLGLAIAEKIAQLHQGTIRVQSEPGRGTTMTVELPARPAEPTPA